MSSLRVHDNPALNHALMVPNTRFRAVFIIDPWYTTDKKMFGVNRYVRNKRHLLSSHSLLAGCGCRWRFLLESLHDLDRNLRGMSSRLCVAKGQPVAVLEKLFRQWNVTHLTFQVQ